MSETTDLPGAETAAERPDRRSLLKKAGVVGVGIWAAPVVTSLTSPAYAQGSPPSGSGCIVLERAANVTVSWVANACNTLAFGLVGGTQFCSNCSNNSGGGGTAPLGSLPAGTDLTFYFEDNGFGSCCNQGRSCNGRYVCGSGTTHVTAVKNSDSQYTIYFVDAGCDDDSNQVCDRVAQDSPPTAGPGVSNLTVTVTLT